CVVRILDPVERQEQRRLTGFARALQTLAPRPRRRGRGLGDNALMCLGRGSRVERGPWDAVDAHPCRARKRKDLRERPTAFGSVGDQDPVERSARSQSFTNRLPAFDHFHGSAGYQRAPFGPSSTTTPAPVSTSRIAPARLKSLFERASSRSCSK